MRSEKTRTMVEIAMLSAIAVVLMLFEFPLPFIAPPFYELDFSEVPVLIGAFALGPWAGVIIEAIKILLKQRCRGRYRPRHLFQFSVLSSALRIMEVIMANCFGVACRHSFMSASMSCAPVLGSSSTKR